MAVTGYIFLIVGAIISFAGTVMLLTAAYRRGLGWFFACLFVPFCWLLFLVVEPKGALRPFALAAGGLLLEYVGGNMAGIEE